VSDERRAELRAATLRGVRWISIARLIAETTALASTIVLARLIPPAEFGRAAVALIVVALAAIIGPAGLTAALVQRRTLERLHVESAGFLGLAVGAFLTALTIALAPAARSVFGDETADLLILASPAWLIAGVGAVSQALLQRELQFGRIAVVDSVSVLAGAGAAVGLAAAGVDAEAIVGGGLVTTAVATALAVASSPPALGRPTRKGVREVGGFATPVALSSLAYAGFRNVDYAILGARMSAANVGFYWRAYQLGVEYQGKISQIMLRISFPVFSRSESMEDLRRMRMRIVRVHASVLVPLLAAFAAVAPVAIPWVFGSVWEPAVAPAQIMAVAGIGHALVTGLGPLMVAIGRPGILLVWNVVELALYGLMVLLLAPYGLIAVSIGVAAFSVVGVVLTQVVLLGPLVGVPVRQFVAEVLPGFVAGACVLGVLWALRAALDAAGFPAAALLAVCGVAGVAVSVAVLRALFADTWNDLALIIRRVSGARRRAPVPVDLPEAAP
jgi:PST family polysaccharide transporter